MTAPTPGRSPADPSGDGRRRSTIAAHSPATAPPGAGAGPGPGGARDGRRGPSSPRPFHPFHHDIEGDSHESHRPPARTAHPGGSAEPAGACARERAQDAGRSGRRGRDEGLHRHPRPAGEPGRPHGRTGRCRRLCRDRRRTPARGHEGIGRGRHDRRRPPGALPGRRRSGDGGRAVAGGEHRPHRHASGRPGDRLHEAGRRRPLRGFHRGAFRHGRAPGRTAPAPRQRRAGPARRLPRRRDRPRSAEGLLRHPRPCPPDGRLGTGRGPGLPALRVAGETAAHRGTDSGHLGGRPVRRCRGLRGRRRQGAARSLLEGRRQRRLVRRPGTPEQPRHGESARLQGRARDPLEVGHGHGRGRLEHHRPLRADLSRARRAHAGGAGRDREAGGTPGRPRGARRRCLDRGAGPRGRDHRGAPRRDRGRDRGPRRLQARGFRDRRLHRHHRTRRHAPGHPWPGPARGHAEGTGSRRKHRCQVW